MGTALASAFLRTGHLTTVWNRTAFRADDLVAAGARRAKTVRDAVTASPLVVLCVVHNDVVRDLLEPHAGELAGTTLVNLTNGTPGQARELAEWANEHGARYLDGGIMATPPMISGPDAVVFYSGDQEGFDTHQETLGVLGAARYFGTDPGQAALHDIALLTGMYGMFAGFLHATALVRANGGTAGELLPLLVGWLQAVLPSLQHAAAQIDSANYRDGVVSPLAMQAAAFGNFIESAHDSGIKPDLLVPLGKLMDAAVAAGHGEHDIASLVEVLKL